MGMGELLEKIEYRSRIELGNILTILAMLAAIITVWADLDKRVVILEQDKITQSQKDKHQDEMMFANSAAIKDSLAELKKYLTRVETQLDNIQDDLHKYKVTTSGYLNSK